MGAVGSDSARAITAAVNRYTYRLEWSPHYDEYIGSCLEFPYVRGQAPTPQQALSDITAAIDEYLADMKELGEPPPPSITDRPYSGTFVVRTSSECTGGSRARPRRNACQ
jgi:predicted RNase H-like HicB family nuclease